MYRLSLRSVLRPARLILAAVTAVCLSGCAGTGTFETDHPGGITVTIPPGTVFGGQQPVAGAHVFVFAANTSGTYGSASNSQLAGGILDTTPGSITNGNFYITTNAQGNFTYGGFTIGCPVPSAQIYLLATGGTQGTGPANTAIHLVAAIGRCDSINTSTVTNIDEVTTVAMATALHGFMTDGAHVGAPSSNATGLVNAFASIKNLVNSSYGTALAVTPAGNGVVPQAKLNTLANIIAACINSGGNTSAACTSLFTATTVGSSVPTNTLLASLNIAGSPASNVANIYALSTATAPFQPALASQPNDFSVGITYSAPTTISQPGAVVVDGSGNTWMTNCQSCLATPPANPIDTLVKFNPDGSFAGSYGAGVLHLLQSIAVDTAGNVWTVNQATANNPQDEVIEVTASGFLGTPITNDHFGTDALQGIAFDKLGNIWLTTNSGLYDFGSGLTMVGGMIIEMNTSGTEGFGSPFNIATAPGGSGLDLAGPSAIAVDNSANIWVLGQSNNSLYKLADNGGATSYIARYTPSGVSTPLGLAINGTSELWMTESNNTLSHIVGSTGANASGSPISGIGLYKTGLLTTDGLGQIIIPNCRIGCAGSGSTAPDNLLRLSSTGSPNTGGATTDSGVQVSGFSAPAAAATDASGAVWVSNSASGTLTQVLGYGAPTVVPLASAVAASKVGVRP